MVFSVRRFLSNLGSFIGIVFSGYILSMPISGIESYVYIIFGLVLLMFFLYSLFIDSRTSFLDRTAGFACERLKLVDRIQLGNAYSYVFEYKDKKRILLNADESVSKYFKMDQVYRVMYLRYDKAIIATEVVYKFEKKR